jgi:phosphoethanolamine N-methyltransferase
MLEAMDLIWGEGFMAPGGEGHVRQMVRGLEVRGRRVLDFGCGQGAPACLLAHWGAEVVGTDLEAALIARARERAEREGLGDRVQLLQVEPGPLTFADDSFDAIVVSGALTQIEDKLATYRECLRVLRPGGALRCYDWMTPPGDLSDDMRDWFELEGLTYALRTPDEHLTMLREAGFIESRCRDKSAWYCAEAAREAVRLRDRLHPQLVALLGPEETARFVEAWRLLAQLCERGELLQVYTEASKPGVPAPAGA